MCNDPEEKTCIKTVNKKTQCHVQFFDERRSRAWVHAKLVTIRASVEGSVFYPFLTRYPFWGIMQTVQTQFRHREMQ